MCIRDRYFHGPVVTVYGVLHRVSVPIQCSGNLRRRIQMWRKVYSTGHPDQGGIDHHCTERKLPHPDSDTYRALRIQLRFMYVLLNFYGIQDLNIWNCWPWHNKPQIKHHAGKIPIWTQWTLLRMRTGVELWTLSSFARVLQASELDIVLPTRPIGRELDDIYLLHPAANLLFRGSIHCTCPINPATRSHHNRHIPQPTV